MAFVNRFPDFMKHPADAISSSSQSPGVRGWVFDGAAGIQMVFWECEQDGTSQEHTHSFDEYFIVIEGRYTLIIDGHTVVILPGREYHIPKNIPHAGEFIAGTRTIHAFGGKRVVRRTDRA